MRSPSPVRKVGFVVVAAAVLLSACASRATMAGRVGTAAAACYTDPKKC